MLQQDHTLSSAVTMKKKKLIATLRTGIWARHFGQTLIHFLVVLKKSWKNSMACILLFAVSLLGSASPKKAEWEQHSHFHFVSQVKLIPIQLEFFF